MSALCAALVLTLGSYHHNPITTDLNELNPGVGCEAQHYSVGYYYNSYRKHTVYAGLKWERRFQLGAGVPWSLGVLAGGVTGYKDELPASLPSLGSVTPMAMPFISVGPERLNVRVFHVPLYVTGVQVRFGFGRTGP